jgi:hypothetical protein
MPGGRIQFDLRFGFLGFDFRYTRSFLGGCGGRRPTGLLVYFRPSGDPPIGPGRSGTKSGAPRSLALGV